ncbi:MAG: glycoside hydrolase family 78 protein [Planctomycetota bacterium]
MCLALGAGAGASADTGVVAAERLRTEYHSNPLGIDQIQPRLSWIVRSDEPGQRQSAYRVLVASTPELLAADTGDLWDTGRVESSQTAQIVYGGSELGSRARCFWKVQAWDHQGRPSPWSEAASWSMGLLDDADWSASYITHEDKSPVFKKTKQLYLPPANQFRKAFTAGKQVKKATLYATALGIYELYLNGKRVGDAYFAPGWSDYNQRAYYQTYDVSELVGDGDNALGIWLAEGWYSGYVGFGLLTGIGTEKTGRATYGKTPSVMAQLEIEYTDGSRETIGTDDSWRVTSDGPIRAADLLMGEEYDATRENSAWSTAGFDATPWGPAILAEDVPAADATFYEFVNPKKHGERPKVKGRPVKLGFKRPRLEAFPGNPVRVTEEIEPIRVLPRPNGAYIFDLGQNFAGVIRLKVKGPAGHRIGLRYGEMLHPDGRLMTENLRKARAQDAYLCKGDPAGETYTPRFTFHGFQYVEVTGLLAPPQPSAVTGLVLHSDTPMVSTFECSDPMVNKLFSNIRWTQRSNFIDLPTDCPQRDERMGWTGDAQIYVNAATYNADVAAFFTKWMRELMESQRPSGVFPGYAPYPFQHGWDFGSAWCDAGVICPWTIWQAYGDTRIIEECWGPMTVYMDWRRSTLKNGLGITQGNPWGDWLSQGARTPFDYIDTVYAAQSARMMSEMAAAIGRQTEAEEYARLLDRVKASFIKKYVGEDGTLGIETQTAYALALSVDLVPEELRPLVATKLADKIVDNGARMSTGFIGTRPLLPVLSATGNNDLAAFLLQSHEFPSWGYEIDQGATSIWERWDSYTREDGFGRHNAAMNSFSHYSFGAVCEWMFGDLAGIRSDGPGYERIIIRPQPPAPGSNGDHEPIDWVRASYDSIRGPIKSAWSLKEGRFELRVQIPTNTTATVILPAADEASITVDGKAIDSVQGVSLVSLDNGQAAIAVPSGAYRFVSTNAVPAATRTFSAKP